MALKVGRSDAKTFFESACPNFLAIHKEQSRALGGSVAFCLRGTAGGIWTVDMTAARVISGTASADVTLYAKASDFEAVFAGQRSAEDAFADGSMSCEGDVGVLARFAELLRLHVGVDGHYSYAKADISSETSQGELP